MDGMALDGAQADEGIVQMDTSQIEEYQQEQSNFPELKVDDEDQIFEDEQSQILNNRELGGEILPGPSPELGTPIQEQVDGEPADGSNLIITQPVSMTSD